MIFLVCRFGLLGYGRQRRRDGIRCILRVASFLLESYFGGRDWYCRDIWRNGQRRRGLQSDVPRNGDSIENVFFNVFLYFIELVFEFRRLV